MLATAKFSPRDMHAFNSGEMKWIEIILMQDS